MESFIHFYKFQRIFKIKRLKSCFAQKKTASWKIIKSRKTIAQKYAMDSEQIDGEHAELAFNGRQLE